MKKKILVAAVIFFAIAAYANAQQQKPSRPVFHSVEQGVLINGNRAVSGALQTVNGIGYGNWFAGIGAGIDFYRYRSVPLFLDLRRSLDMKNGTSCLHMQMAVIICPGYKR